MFKRHKAGSLYSDIDPVQYLHHYKQKFAELHSARQEKNSIGNLTREVSIRDKRRSVAASPGSEYAPEPIKQLEILNEVTT